MIIGYKKKNNSIMLKWTEQKLVQCFILLEKKMQYLNNSTLQNVTKIEYSWFSIKYLISFAAVEKNVS